VRLWARTTSDTATSSPAFGIVAGLPVDIAVLDGEPIVMRSADRCDFEALRSRQGQAEAIWSPMTSWRRTGRTCALLMLAT
jgi:ATP-dependent DNA ligase